MNTHDKYELPPPAQRIPYVGDVWTREQINAAIEADRKRRGEPVAWALTQQQVIALAEELIVGASTLGGMDDDGIECDVRLMVRMPGTIADDDGNSNDKPILAFCLDDYPEEGVYPIDPAECKPQAAPQPAEPVKVPSEEEIEALAFEYCDETGAGGDCPRFIGTQSITRLIRALLARYGQPAKPAASAEPVGYVFDCVSSPKGGYHIEARVERPIPDGTKLYTAPVAAQPSVPDGWRLVPIILNRKMRDVIRLHEGPGDLPEDTYVDLLDAAPTPPADAQDNITITENGGVQLNTRNPEVANKLFSLIDQFRSARPSGSHGDMTALQVAEAYNSDIPVTEQEEEEWKRLEDRK